MGCERVLTLIWWRSPLSSALSWWWKKIIYKALLLPNYLLKNFQPFFPQTVLFCAIYFTTEFVRCQNQRLRQNKRVKVKADRNRKFSTFFHNNFVLEISVFEIIWTVLSLKFKFFLEFSRFLTFFWLPNPVTKRKMKIYETLAIGTLAFEGK